MVNLSHLRPTDSNLMDADMIRDVFGPDYHRTVRVVMIAVMIIISVLGNVVVCWQLLNSRRLHHSKPKILFLNLSVADLLVTMVTMTSQLIWEVMGRSWIAGDVFCRLFKVLQTFALVSSTYMLVGIALDRYYVIVHPLSSYVSSWKLPLAAWMASLLPSLPNAYIFREVQIGKNQYLCSSLFYTENYPRFHRQLYMAAVFLTVFIIPFCLLVALYSRILLEIRRQSSAMRNCHQTASALPRAKVKTMMMAMSIFVAFMITNLPYVIQEMVLAFGNPETLDKNTVALFGVISASNSSINPYIYLIFHSKLDAWNRFASSIKAVKNSSISRIQAWHSRLSYKNTSLTNSRNNTRNSVDVLSSPQGEKSEALQLTVLVKNSSLLEKANYV
ncbi:cardioacceleratory peptide receptor-like [Limulus polyphemus]|uniref:Cardioacceleratory peptide receptor-like n=1 Tax=Limulus polyphemus TaxID=6850 RepID=A0ABM1BWS2_LIMPO|nr:cardioacceleratory peptide receptor-like [Limulus polyphemus]